jgi:hypothetical protein
MIWYLSSVDLEQIKILSSYKEITEDHLHLHQLMQSITHTRETITGRGGGGTWLRSLRWMQRVVRSRSPPREDPLC